MTRIAIAIVCGLSALQWIHRGHYRIRNRRELEAVGYTDRTIGSLTAGLTAAAGTATGLISQISGASTQGTIAWCLGVMVWMPHIAPPFIEHSALVSYRKRRNRAALFFLRRLQLSIAGGESIRGAAQIAAQDMTDRAFSDVAAAVHAAIAARQSPLDAIARQLAGSGIETLLAATAAAEGTGARTHGRLDELISRAVQSLESDRRVDVERLGRSVNTLTATSMMLGTIPLVLAILGSLSI